MKQPEDATVRHRDTGASCDGAPAGTSFDLFGTLVEVDRPSNPATAIATELESRGVTVPSDWEKRYRTPQIDIRASRELSLPDHVRAILADCDALPTAPGPIHEAILAAFDSPVRTRDGATSAVRAASDWGPVGILSNCSVPGLVARTLDRSVLDRDRFDTVVTSVACGWRKPDARAFEVAANQLDVPVAELLHVGDDPKTDGGATDAGATALLLEDVPLGEIPECITKSESNWR